MKKALMAKEYSRLEGRLPVEEHLLKHQIKETSSHFHVHIHALECTTDNSGDRLSMQMSKRVSAMPLTYFRKIGSGSPMEGCAIREKPQMTRRLAVGASVWPSSSATVPYSMSTIA